ncbi:hypothetical protein IFM89_034325 [Coptis chinensis]|uniref:Pectinesterase n=1 Tax=Coptis chinensis TaxID=261450 RepID=A0A835IHC3_9MAGN|nr:hypothetical protein IFM89_034325 [Coptis chinensis]
MKIKLIVITLLSIYYFVSFTTSHHVSRFSINKVRSGKEENETDGFPASVSTSDRRLLLDPDLRPHGLYAPRYPHTHEHKIVVAQDGLDGSGKYRTINEAIAAVAKYPKERKGRLVTLTHVKAGVYDEKVLIGKKLQNITLLGDGIGKTIITGNRRQVPGKTSTMNSATRATAAPDFRPYMDRYPEYLGRPWGNFSKTVFIRTFLDSFIAPEGWLKWSEKLYLDGTVYYGEYMNYGPGAWTDRRVKWGGYHLLSTEYEVSQFTVEKLIGGLSWLTATKVPFYADH